MAWLALLLGGGCSSPSSRTAESSPPAVEPALEAAGGGQVEPDGPGRLHVGGAEIRVEYEGRTIPLEPEVLEQWVKGAASMVSDYLGEFPVPSLELTLVGRGFGGVGFGMHQDGRWITVYCGTRTSVEGLENDWVMVHEMLHAGFPDLDRRHRWMQEGLSTYLEPIVRARAGNTTESEVWRRWTRSMHYGRPERGDEGLDHTHTWGRTYWGGALFWMMVDVEVRKRTKNEQSIRDLVRGVLAEGGNGRVHWSTDQVVEVMDATTGTSVVSELYAQMAQAPGDVDLDALYTELGVARVDGVVTFDDEAPLASIRRAMTAQ